MTIEEAREEGKYWAQWEQKGSGIYCLPTSDPHWRTLLLKKAAERDQMKRLASLDDKQAAWEAAFLDGYLSMWD